MKRLTVIIAIIGLFASPGRALEISLQYESPGDEFFTPSAKATLSKAAADVSQAITTSLSALNQSTFVGTNVDSEATVSWSFNYISPNSGLPSPNVTTFDFLQDEFRIVVGRRNLGESTLGRGGPAGAGISLQSSGFVGFEEEWAGAVANVESASNAAMPRGGPTVGNFTGVFALSDGDTEPVYSLDYGFSLGSLAFNQSTNWNFEYATGPAPGEIDFYSVAIHEILHAIGFGVGLNFESLVSGTDWMGPEVLNLLGTDVNVLNPDRAHIADGLMGRPFIDGLFGDLADQEPAMADSLTAGTRKYLTDLDLAFLNDAGWSVVPEPSTILLLLCGGLALLFIRR